MRNKDFEKWLSVYRSAEIKLDSSDLRAAYEAGQAKGPTRTNGFIMDLYQKITKWHHL